MTKRLFPQRTPDTKYSSRYVQSFPVNLPVEKIDLYKWATEMTDADYASYSSAHKAMASYRRDHIFYMKNVENIGTDTLIQQYELKYHAPGHIQFYSSNSKACILRWFPVTVAVPWELYIQPVSATSSRLICLIGTDFPNLVLKIAAWFSGVGGLFLSRHLTTEGKAFALDIEKKFKPD
ncbi:MAG: hypothetical protein WDO19_21060 [Bacteroidota bacterium]